MYTAQPRWLRRSWIYLPSHSSQNFPARRWPLRLPSWSCSAPSRPRAAPLRARLLRTSQRSTGRIHGLRPPPLVVARRTQAGAAVAGACRERARQSAPTSTAPSRRGTCSTRAPASRSSCQPAGSSASARGSGALDRPPRAGQPSRAVRTALRPSAHPRATLRELRWWRRRTPTAPRVGGMPRISAWWSSIVRRLRARARRPTTEAWRGN